MHRDARLEEKPFLTAKHRNLLYPRHLRTHLLKLFHTCCSYSANPKIRSCISRMLLFFLGGGGGWGGWEGRPSNLSLN